MSTGEVTHVPVTIQMRPATVDFIDKAAKAAGKSRTAFLRDANVAAAEKELGNKAPVVTTFELGNQNPISRAAREAGLSTKEYMRKVALEALGHSAKEAAAMAKTKTRKPRKAKVAKGK